MLFVEIFGFIFSLLSFVIKISAHIVTSNYYSYILINRQALKSLFKMAFYPLTYN